MCRKNICSLNTGIRNLSIRQEVSADAALQGCIQCYVVILPANNGLPYANEKTVTFGRSPITNSEEQTYIVEASALGTTDAQYARYFVHGGTVALLDSYNTNSTIGHPALRFNSAGILQIRMNGTTGQTYSAAVVIKRF